MSDKYIIYQGPSDEKPRSHLQEPAAIMLDIMRKQVAMSELSDIKVGVSLPLSIYAQGVIDACNAMLRWTRDEMVDLRHGRGFRGRYPARYAGR